MMRSFAEIYAATPFDDDSPFDTRAEMSRQVILETWHDNLERLAPNGGEEIQAAMSGLLVGIVQIALSSIIRSDEADAAVRSGLIQLIPWAVDLTRDMEGKSPLSGGN